MNMNRDKISWKDISIKKYLLILELLLEDKNEIIKMGLLINICYDLDMDNIPMVKALEYQDDIRALLNTQPEIKECQKKYQLGQYTCKPVGFENMTMALFMDFQLFAGTGENHLVDTLSVCLVPVGHKYNDGYDMDELREAIENMSIEFGPAIFNFFLKRLNKYWRRSLRCLTGKIMMSRELKWKEKMAMVKALPMVLNSLDYFIML